MVDRVTTFAQSQTLLAELMRAQSRQFEAQRQVSSGKVGDSFSDIPKDTGVLLAAKRADSRTDEFLKLGNELMTRLDIQDLQITRMANETQSLRESVTEAVANESGLALMERLDSVFRSVANVLNAKIDGRYIYGGTRTDTAPVTVESLADLLALPAVADAFQNNGVKQAAKIDESQTVEYGQLASELGSEVFGVLRDIAAYNAGANGPFATKLTATQVDYLKTQLTSLETATSNLNLKAAENGVIYKEVQDAGERHDTARTYLAGVISDIEDVDMAEAVVRLQQSQLAVEASAKTFATLQGLSLLDFI